MPEQFVLLITETIKVGFVGVVAVVLAWVCYRLYQRIESITDERIKDHQKIIPVIEANTRATEANTAAFAVLKAVVEASSRRGD